jgi:DNA-directed RNA polymerase specialized sigma24 family protein
VCSDANLGELLQRARVGDRVALDRLFSATHAELQALARRRLRALPRITMLDTVGLVNESYLRLIQAGRLDANDRPHFLRYAARIMRSVIVDDVRRRSGRNALLLWHAGARDRGGTRHHRANRTARLAEGQIVVSRGPGFSGMSERVPTLSELLDSMLDLPAERRAEWIDSLPGEQDALKPRLRRLMNRQVHPWRRHQRGKPCHQIQRFQHNVRGSIAVALSNAGSLPYRRTMRPQD